MIRVHDSLMVEVQWDGEPTDEERTATIDLDEHGMLRITQHNRNSSVPVANGPFATGRCWYTVGDCPVEYDSFVEAVLAHLPEVLRPR